MFAALQKHHSKDLKALADHFARTLYGFWILMAIILALNALVPVHQPLSDLIIETIHVSIVKSLNDLIIETINFARK